MLSTSEFAKRVLIVLAMAAGLLLLWQVAAVLLLAFGGIVLAVIIRTAGAAIARLLPIPVRWASLLGVLLVLVGAVVLALLLGDEVAGQMGELARRLPEAIETAKAWLEGKALGRALLSTLSSAASAEGVSAGKALVAASSTFSVLSDVVVVLLVALYLSFSPGTYFRGLLVLVPQTRRGDAEAALDTAGQALHGWLLGTLVSMVSVGLLVAAGLWLVGVPMPLGLGLIAGLLEFVPVLGPFAAAVPGVLLAFAAGPREALLAAAVYFVVQQLEGGLIMPLAQKWSVQLPPALGLLALMVFGVLFGIPGLLLATPLTVVLMALVKRFYVDRR